jgi:hypothetical protein
VSLEFHLRLAGALLLLLAAAHFFFPRALGWKEDLAKLTLLNRQVFLVHVGFIVLILTLFGTLALFFTADLLAPFAPGGGGARRPDPLLGLRLVTQHLIYDRSLWQGHRRNTVLHLLAALDLPDRRLRVGMVAAGRVTALLHWTMQLCRVPVPRLAFLMLLGTLALGIARIPS